ncbi:hypothetical protein [Longimicrobium sp.]|uniref:hypothetical protein n=1 Tax=Longimicrobium sp. TaxID=2029185 RepID=UPI002E2F9DFA|nr:hypothetical protein [Longimicrobium sp.]HEX6041844.1 hypothetical protein [Longimicrobium sp.]
MFGITRRHTIDHAPAFPRPAFRFPDGTPMPVYAEEEGADEPTDERSSESQTPSS